MTHEEKRAWIRLIATVVSYLTYVAVVLGRADGRALSAVPYAAVLLWAVSSSIVGSIVAEIGIGIANPRASRTKDVRDRQIGRLSEHVGQSLVIVGALAAMLMAMRGWDRFWIANVIYLCFTLSAILSSIAKVAMYRGSLPPW